LQKKIDKQAQIKSIKDWFNDMKHDEYWWTSNIAIPSDIVTTWGLQTSTISSGQFQSEHKTLQKHLMTEIIGHTLCRV